MYCHYTYFIYLQSEACDKSELQLVGVTAMLIASKYEEMYAPQVDDFVFITDKTYSSDKIRSMERHMLKTLNYSFGNPLCLHFLRRYSRAGNVSSNFTVSDELCSIYAGSSIFIPLLALTLYVGWRECPHHTIHFQNPPYSLL